MRTWCAPFLVVTALVAGAFPQRVASDGDAADASATTAAAAFVRALRPESFAAASFPFDDPLRLDWHFIPRERRGLSLAAMDDGERRATHALLRTLLTPIGYERTLGVIGLESVLREIEGNPGRDPGRYFVQRFGEPFGSGTAALRFEGHHLALNFTSVEGCGIVATPFFLGANPSEVKSGAQAGRKLLAEFESVARDLARSLSAEQRRAALLSETAPAEVLFGPGATPPDLAAGVSASALRAEQRLRLAGLEAAVTGMVACGRDGLRESGQSAPASGGETTRFAWAGSLHEGAGHYWRIARADLLIEYDNTQNGANHVHLLWRDPRNDFGADWLARHLSDERRPGDAGGSGR